MQSIDKRVAMCLKEPVAKTDCFAALLTFCFTDLPGSPCTSSRVQNGGRDTCLDNSNKHHSYVSGMSVHASYNQERTPLNCQKSRESIVKYRSVNWTINMHFMNTGSLIHFFRCFYPK